MRRRQIYAMMARGPDKKPEIPAVESTEIHASLHFNEDKLNANNKTNLCQKCGKSLGKRPDVHMRFCKDK